MSRGTVVSTRWRLAGAVALIAIVASACSSGTPTTAPSAAPATQAAATQAPASTAPSAAPSEAAAPVSIDWWHITTAAVGKADFQAIADAYMAAHPNVKINITVLDNDPFKTKLAARGADRAQHPELARALVDREHQRVDDAEQRDDHRQREQHVDERSSLLTWPARVRLELRGGPRPRLRERAREQAVDGRLHLRVGRARRVGDEVDRVVALRERAARERAA